MGQDMTLTASRMTAKLQELADAALAARTAHFFKTGKGQYGEGDIFLGISVPALRVMAKECKAVDLQAVLQLLRSDFHEARLLAVLLLVALYKRGNQAQREEICRQYLAHAVYVNNWDIVDSSAPYIVGPELLGQDHKQLFRLARSKSLWERRIAVMATFHFIKQHQYDTTLQLVALLIDDKEDLMHKACGWMLREVGNRDLAVEREFLDQHLRRMPRTMLRYAIEKFPEKLRLHYLYSR
jgi:3-methyladenine DNA glycosylase AlkD